jgi:hypothetical protein
VTTPAQEHTDASVAQLRTAVEELQQAQGGSAQLDQRLAQQHTEIAEEIEAVRLQVGGVGCLLGALALHVALHAPSTAAAPAATAGQWGTCNSCMHTWQLGLPFAYLIINQTTPDGQAIKQR